MQHYIGVIISLLLISYLMLSSCKSDDDTLVVCTPSIDTIPDIDTIPKPCLFTFHDFSIPMENRDSNFGVSQCPISIQFLFPDKYFYSDPTYNPIDQNEIAFIRRNNDNVFLCQSELCVFNFCTGELNVLANEVCRDPIDWSVQNWISYSGSGQQLFKVKSTGDSLMQLTTSGINYNPSWSATGDSLFYYQKKSSESYYKIVDQKGETISIIDVLYNTGAQKLSKNNLISHAGGSDNGNDYGVYLYNLETKAIEQIDLIDTPITGPVIRDTEWNHNNESIQWTTTLSIINTNIFTRERTFVESGADNRKYGSTSISPDGQHIIIEQIDFKKTQICEMEARGFLYIMNADGSEKRKIIFPE